MIEKKLSPKGKSLKVTFKLPATVAEESVAVVGDFNNWDAGKHQMKLSVKNGEWTRSISFKPGTAHEFRYFVDGRQWKNDDAADGYVGTEFLSQNCLLET